MGGRGGGGTARQQNITVGHLGGFMAVACRVQNNGRGSCGRGDILWARGYVLSGQ